MKLSLNKNESRLVKLLLVMAEESMMLGDLECYLMEQYNMTTEEFNQTYKTLEHKLQQVLGKFTVGVK